MIPAGAGAPPWVSVAIRLKAVPFTTEENCKGRERIGDRSRHVQFVPASAFSF
jgi:hypothetical protein